MQLAKLQMLGVELYFDDLPAARRFYCDTLGLEISDEALGHYAKFNCGSGFLCLERKGSESYPSRDKAVVFFEVANLQDMVDTIGCERLVHLDSGDGKGRPAWAVLHDPEGHNVLLLQHRRGDESSGQERPSK